MGVHIEQGGWRNADGEESVNEPELPPLTSHFGLRLTGTEFHCSVFIFSLIKVFNIKEKS